MYFGKFSFLTWELAVVIDAYKDEIPCKLWPIDEELCLFLSISSFWKFIWIDSVKESGMRILFNAPNFSTFL